MTESPRTRRAAVPVPAPWLAFALALGLVAATVWLFAYDKSHTTQIQRGENGGVRLTNTNVVRAIRHIGEWNGKKTEIKVPVTMLGIDSQDGCAIVVQDSGTGAILGAADFPLTKKGS